jgi:hypothetical protein
MFRVDFLAKLALLADGNGLHNEFHPACFTGAIFSVAVLSEVAPFPVTALKPMLVEETHGFLRFCG